MSLISAWAISLAPCRTGGSGPSELSRPVRPPSRGSRSTLSLSQSAITSSFDHSGKRRMVPCNADQKVHVPIQYKRVEPRPPLGMWPTFLF